MSIEVVQFRNGLRINERRMAAGSALFVALCDFAEAGGTRASVKKYMQWAFSDAELLLEEKVVPLRPDAPRS